MRLLHTRTLELEDFFEKDLPHYAILSHRWEMEEVTFQDLAFPGNRLTAQSKIGFSKIRGACELASSQGYQYVWIDTCCIDKSSSAELTEAINSMYNWYKSANICYAFLSDIWGQTFLSSQWFTRGWTLQELIAPQTLEFYSAEWKFLGTRRKHSSQISEATGINIHVLLGGDPTEISVARRMSWAATRKTTRIEDEAYCLMGLFDINMPLIYGEGKKAFRRLQEEIIRLTNDQSIFAWYPTGQLELSSTHSLAPSPKEFLQSGGISSQPSRRFGQRPINVENQGISVELTLLPIVPHEAEKLNDYDYYYDVEAILDCQLGDLPGTVPIIRLRKALETDRGVESPYYRVITPGPTQFAFLEGRALLSSLETLYSTSVLGFDPTQLQNPAYKETLDNVNKHWQKRLVTITHRLPRSITSTGLRESSSDPRLHPPSTTDFWVMSIQVHGILARIGEVYPAEQWDKVSGQFRTIRREVSTGWKGVDAVFGLDFVGPLKDEFPLRSSVSLLVGRQSDSRSKSPFPWCRLVFDGKTRNLAGLYSGYKAEIAFSEQMPVYYEPSEHWLSLGNSQRVKVSVRPKEISGVMYHVLCIEPQILGSEDSGFLSEERFSESLNRQGSWYDVEVAMER